MSGSESEHPVVEKDLSEVAQSLVDDDLDKLLANIIFNIRTHAQEVGGPIQAKDILTSRFLPTQQMYNEGYVTCGTITNISAAMLRSLGYEVKLIHGRIPETPTHAWISVKDKESNEWQQYDLTQRDRQITPNHRVEYTVDDWEEIRDFLEDWHNGRFKQ